ncbi:hypothetical protein P5673_010880 [Acropora cervicornis]|uniref:Uncharacterized protein n=1 Tax=Acropora cervicornis TaxID=6130 RepID=A0AAD9QQW4_ACRCE|nr:hypothetical protein P5673_010880 [Acropora cervicornis]
MPFKQVRLNTSDPPWINEKFKTLISSDSKLSTEMTKIAISITAIKSTVKGNHPTAVLKHANVPCVDILNFYCTAIRPVLEYCVPLFRRALPQYLNEDIERVQKRVVSIINPHMSY